jgi:DNA-binding YbaB/EbfC family protein
MDGLLRQAQQLQGAMRQIQEGLARKTVEGSSGGGMVRVVCSGGQEILSFSLEDSLLLPEEKDVFQDLLTAAANDALRKARALAEQEMSAVTGGLKLPFMP